MGHRLQSPWLSRLNRRNLMTNLDTPPPGMGPSGEEGAGLASLLPDPSGRTARIRRLARALGDFAETLLSAGTLTHYADALTNDHLCDLFEEVNNRTAAVLQSIGEEDTCPDVDEVFDAVEQAVHKALRDSQAR